MIRNRAVVDAVRDGIILVDTETGMIVDANPAAEILCGRSVAELRALHCAQLHPTEAGQCIFAPGLREGHVLHKDGHRIPVEISANDFISSDGRRMLVSTFRDTTERDEAREARQSEERLRQVAESAGEFTWEVDANGLYLYVSPLIEQILGYTPDEVVGKTHFYDLLAPETREETKTAAFEVFARREKIRAFPNSKVTKDGRLVALETNGRPMLDTNGNLLGYRGVDRDVTERKQAEEALRENQERLVSIYNTVGDVLFHLAVESEGQFRFVSVNAAFLRVTGLSMEDVVGKTVHEVIPEPSLTLVLEKYRQAIAEKTTVLWEETSEYPTGRLTGEVSIAPVFDSHGTCTHLVGSVRDMTGRKQVEMRLTESEERFRLAQSAAQVVAWDWDPRTNFIAFYGKSAHLYGFTQERTTLTFEQCLDVIEPDDRTRVQAHIREALDRTHIVDAEFRVRWPNGTTHWLRIRGTVLLDDSGLPIRALGVSGDITDRKQTEEALRQSERMLAAELDAARHLQHVATQLISTHGLEPLYEEILDAAMAILHSDFASIQMFHPERGTSGELHLLGHRGFNAQFAQGFEWVRPTTRTSCGEALRTGRRVAVADVRHCDFMAESDELEGYLGGGILAAQSTPLVSRSGSLVGMVSTHWHQAHQLSASELQALDILARLAADLIERSRAEEKLRKSEELLRSAQRLARVGNWDWDFKTNRIFWSDEVFEFSGYPRDYEPSFEGFLRSVAPVERERMARELRRALAKKQGFSSHVQIKQPDGQVRTIGFVADLRFDEAGTPVGMFGSSQDITDVQKNEAKLRQNQTDLRALTARLVDLQESGMKELARELHDDLSQRLAALGGDLSNLLPPSARRSRSFSEHARALHQQITQMANDVHSLSTRLHPSILHDLGLKAALKDECRRFSAQTGIPVRLESEGESTAPSPDVSLCFYRVAQESLHNIAKHARATKVRLTLANAQGTSTLRIEDNGQGFDPSGAKAKDALGLISMNERARQVNGSLTIKSALGKGTKLEVSVGSRRKLKRRHG